MSTNICSDLVSDSKACRQAALKQLLDQIKQSDTVQLDCQNIFTNYSVHVFKGFRDTSEVCRELSLDLMSALVQNLDMNDYYLTYIFPVIVERIGTPELVEDSEELRLRVVQFMKEIVIRYAGTDYLVPFLGDISKVLQQTVMDRYPKVKQESCECIIETANALPRHFHMQNQSLIKPVLCALSHQHYRVRVAAVRAIGTIILHDTGGKALESTTVPLAERLFDQIPAVRCAVLQVAYKLLTEYRDRYSFFQKLLPLMLTGLCDEVNETRLEAEQLWYRVGEHYAAENEKDLKDQTDYMEIINECRARPNLGCRELVRRHTSKMIPALCRELNSTWQDDIRLRCGQLLYAIILHAEESFTHNLQDVLPTMFVTCQRYRSPDEPVCGAVMRAGQLIGRYVHPDLWCKLLYSSMSKDSPTHGHLRILRSVAEGCSVDGNWKDQLAALLATRDVCLASRNEVYLHELTHCCRTLSENGPVSPTIALNLSMACLAAVSLQNVRNNDELLEKLWSSTNVNSDLCSKVLSSTSAPSTWTVLTPDHCMLEAILIRAVNPERLDLSLVVDTLVCCLTSDVTDAEARIRTFFALSSSLQMWTERNVKPTTALLDFHRRITSEILIPNLVWHAGRTAEAVRTVALNCLCSILEWARPHKEVVRPWVLLLLADFIPLLVSLLDDALSHTRRFAAKVITLLLNCTPPTDGSTVVSVYPVLLKRLDDPSDAVREEAVKAIESVFCQLSPECTEALVSNYSKHLELIIDTLLVHIQDVNDTDMQNKYLEILKLLRGMHPDYMKSKVDKVRQVLITKHLLDSLI